MDSATKGFESRTISIKLWPPSETTRETIVERMTKNLSTESIFSRKYGLINKDEAFEIAKQIEADCFAFANEHFEQNSDGVGSSTVQIYAQETSKRMIEVIKRGSKHVDVAKEVRAISPSTSPPKTVFDLSGHRRDFLDADEARELLTPLTEEGNAYTKICFSNRSFGIEAARVAEPILVSLKNQLVDVDLSDFIAGRPEDEALEVMRLFSTALEGCRLKSLDLSNNALGEKGIRAFEALFRSQTGLEELYLKNNGISENAAEVLCELIPSTEKLRVLHFHNNMTGDRGAIAIAEVLKRCPLLEDFRCSSTRVDSEGGIMMSEALQTCAHLKKLDLSDNLFGVNAGIALSKTLEKLGSITELYLSYLNLENTGAIAIFNSLKQSLSSLEVLEIAGNEITEKAAPSLAAFLKAKQTLKNLGLSENELKDEGAIMIGKVLEGSNPQLKELDFSTNNLRRVGARCLARAVVSNKPDFALLNINGNAISEEEIEEVKKIFKDGKKPESTLGPLDENDPEGEEREEEDEDGYGDEDTDALDSKLQNLGV